MTTFHEEEKRYTLVSYTDGVKNITHLYFREGEWFLTETWEKSEEHPVFPSSRYFQIQGFHGPLADYIKEYQAFPEKQKQISFMKETLGEYMDTLMFTGAKNAN